MEIYHKGYIYQTYPRGKSFGITVKERMERFLEPEDQGFYFEIISPSDMKNIHEASKSWLPKQEMNKYSSNRHVIMKEE